MQTPSSPLQDLVLAFQLRSRDVGYDLKRAARAFELIHDLSGNGVRIDLSWFDVEPDENGWDQAKVKWYKDFCGDAARAPVLMRI